MNLTLKATLKENANMSKLVKQMCSLKCRIKVDSENGNISIVEMDDNSIESVIDSISEAFNITGVDIVPTVVIPEPEKPVVTEDSIEFEKVEFRDADVEEQVNKLMRVMYWAMYFAKAKSRDICQYLMTTSDEISMKYNSKEPVKCEVGDIVDCNYGSHLKKEISGGHVHSIICDIDENGMLYVVPITKDKLYGEPEIYLPFSRDVDVTYSDSKFMGGTVLLKMGRYINNLRVRYVVGHVLPDFFNSLLKSLPSTVDFSCNVDIFNNSKDKLTEQMGDVQNDDSMLSFEEIGEQENETIIEGSGENVVENHIEDVSGEDINQISTEESKIKARDKKVSAEDYLTEIVSDALNTLNKSKSVEEQIDGFLDAIGFSKNEKIVRHSFISACVVKKIRYESIIIELHNTFPKLSEEIIKTTLNDEFKKWLAIHPEVKENYPKISIMVLLKIFAKKMA